MTSHRVYAALLSAALLSSCDKDAVQQLTGPVPGSQIKFFNFGVGAPAVNFYANDQKITAILTATGTESTVGTVYGGAGAAGLYAAIDPGQYTLTGKITATVDKDRAIATVSSTLEDGKSYSFYMSGFYNTTAKTVDGFVVEDPLPPAVEHLEDQPAHLFVIDHRPVDGAQRSFDPHVRRLVNLQVEITTLELHQRAE